MRLPPERADVRAESSPTYPLKLLGKCEFTIADDDKGIPNARGEEVEEYILKLE
jgi:hypothetical protein